MAKKIIVCLCCLLLLFAAGCRSYDQKLDIGYFFKTGPEKAAIDFLQAMEGKDPGYIYDNLMLTRDKNNISRQKYMEEFLHLLEDVEQIEIQSTVYLGYEDNMSRVVVEFDTMYADGTQNRYKKYLYLMEEGNAWKIVFEKTFI